MSEVNRRNGYTDPFTTTRSIYALRAMMLAFSLLLSVLSVSACSFSDVPGGGQASAPPKNAENTVTELAAVKAAPSAMDSFRALAPPEGMKFTALFAEPLVDSEARLTRLESAVQNLRNDFDTVVPSLVRLVAVEKDMKELIGQLKTLTASDAGEAMPMAEPLPLPVPEVETETTNEIPGEDVTDRIKASVAESSPVTPEAASEGKLPPADAASPSIPVKADHAQQPVPPPVNLVAQASPVKQKQEVLLAPVAAEKPDVTMGSAMAALPAPKPIAEKNADEASVVKPATDELTQPPHGMQQANVAVKSVRVADHKDRTRIVIDISGDATYKAAMETNGKALVVDMAGLGWDTAKVWDAMTAELIAGYQYSEGKIYFDVIYPSVIKSQILLPPGDGSPNYRLVIDLYSEHVHKK